VLLLLLRVLRVQTAACAENCHTNAWVWLAWPRPEGEGGAHRAQPGGTSMPGAVSRPGSNSRRRSSGWASTCGRHSDPESGSGGGGELHMDCSELKRKIVLTPKHGLRMCEMA
jgi:hypothetical protein